MLAINNDSSENTVAQIPAQWFGRTEPHSHSSRMLETTEGMSAEGTGAMLRIASHEFLTFFHALPRSVGRASALTPEIYLKSLLLEVPVV